MVKIIHYRKKCIGSGVCFEQQPDLWRMSKKDGKATLVNAIAKKELFMLTVDDETGQQTRSLATDCPTKIIKFPK